MSFASEVFERLLSFFSDYSFVNFSTSLAILLAWLESISIIISVLCSMLSAILWLFFLRFLRIFSCYLILLLVSFNNSIISLSFCFSSSSSFFDEGKGGS